MTLLKPAEVVLMPVDLIQAINAEIQGIEWAPMAEEYPRAMDSGNLPMAVTFPGQGSTKGRSELRLMDRQYIVDVYVGSVGQGLHAETMIQAMQLDSLFVHAWTNRINDAEEHVLDYGEDSGVRVDLVRDMPILDSGWRMDMEWLPDVPYYGFRITLPLLLRWGEGL